MAQPARRAPLPVATRPPPVSRTEQVDSTDMFMLKKGDIAQSGSEEVSKANSLVFLKDIGGLNFTIRRTLLTFMFMICTNEHAWTYVLRKILRAHDKENTWLKQRSHRSHERMLLYVCPHWHTRKPNTPRSQILEYEDTQDASGKGSPL